MKGRHPRIWMPGTEGCLERENRVGKRMSLAVVRITPHNESCLILGDFGGSMYITHLHISLRRPSLATPFCRREREVQKGEVSL